MVQWSGFSTAIWVNVFSIVEGFDSLPDELGDVLGPLGVMHRCCHSSSQVEAVFDGSRALFEDDQWFILDGRHIDDRMSDGFVWAFDDDVEAPRGCGIDVFDGFSGVWFELPMDGCRHTEDFGDRVEDWAWEVDEVCHSGFLCRVQFFLLVGASRVGGSGVADGRVVW